MRAKVFRPGKRGSAATLGPLEAEIMETIWAAPQPLTVGDVSLRFNNRKPVLAYSTIKAVLSNLARKGHVRKQSAGKANTFLAAQSKVDFERDVVGPRRGVTRRIVRRPMDWRTIRWSEFGLPVAASRSRRARNDHCCDDSGARTGYVVSICPICGYQTLTTIIVRSFSEVAPNRD